MKRILIMSLGLAFILFTLCIGCEQGFDFTSSKEIKNLRFQTILNQKRKLIFCLLWILLEVCMTIYETLGQGFQNFTAHISEFSLSILVLLGADQYAASLKVVGQNGERYIDSSMLNKEESIISKP